ncbi:hypothetical protein B0T17DRAFT_487491 [Bombardia bombarda]|uniref:C2H2-type domain-containing protein n=1 Tax=Bombardia bombarda TaxID=252184 RepID=A0AA40C831_9PEZI|nr:hypothetical protein B0T17DRAFT_487491 [Bombardia bombarda]
MNGSFEPPNHFSRNAFHGHSQSSDNNHLGLQYSIMDSPTLQPSQQQVSPADSSRFSTNGGGAYESHDDLCVDTCMGVGLYNGSQHFNHRGGSTNFSTRWPTRGMSLRDNSGSLYDYQDLDALSHYPSHSSSFQAPWYGAHQLQHQPHPQSTIRGTDEDCHSMGEMSCCDSQCTMTGKCTNVACANKDDACTDQSCPSRPVAVPSEVVDGAAALISINHAPESGPSHHSYDMPSSSESRSLPPPVSPYDGPAHGTRTTVMDGMDFRLPHSSQQNIMAPPLNYLPIPLGNITSHLLVAHGDANSSTCVRPCLLDNPLNYPNCHMPDIYSLSPFAQYNSVGTELQVDQGFPVCGVEVHDPEAFLRHFNAQHRHLFTSSGELTFAGSAAPQNEAVSASTENMSRSPATPFDTSDSGASMNTPSPLTPLSHSMDMPDIKHSSQSPRRSMSVGSSDSTPDDSMGQDCEHRCLWREEGSSEICGQTFTESGDLFTHTVSAHIRYATKGTQGFCCGWKDCPRSEAGATGFPQRSKIERHMQTHIGHKPHVCPTCHKGFSAKQALNQHMFIHTEEKPLECNICQKTFRYPSALTMHQRVHSGLKPLKCPVCSKSFSESSNLSKHKRTHEVKGRFNCNVAGCDRNFHRQDQLRRHMKTHQREGGDSSKQQVDMLVTKFDNIFEHGSQN